MSSIHSLTLREIFGNERTLFQTTIIVPQVRKTRFDRRRSRAFFCLRSGRSISTSYIPGIAMFLHPFSMDYGVLAQHDRTSPVRLACHK